MNKYTFWMVTALATGFLGAADSRPKALLPVSEHFTQVRLVHIYDNKPLTDFALTPDGKLLVAVGAETQVRDFASQKVLAQVAQSLPYGRVVASPDGQSAAIAAGDTLEFRTLPLLDLTSSRKVDGKLTALALSPDAKRLAYAACTQEAQEGEHTTCVKAEVHLIEVDKTKPVYDWDAGFDYVFALQFTADGSSLLAGICAAQRQTEFGRLCSDGRVVAWNTVTFQESGRSPSFDRTVFGLALTPDEKTLAAASREGRLVLLSFPDFKPVTTKIPESQAVGRLIFPADGKTLFGSSRDRIRAWDLGSGGLLARFGVFRITNLKWAPDHALLLAGNDDGDLYEFGPALKPGA